MNHSDKNNPRRLIRAIEIRASEFTGKVAEPLLLISECNWIGLAPEKETLSARIHDRVFRRLEAGAITEYESLKEKYPSWTKEAKAAIGYSEIEQFLRDELTQEQLIELWTLHEVQYAKRQMTWWKREQQINWFPAHAKNLKELVSTTLKSCYNEFHE